MNDWLIILFLQASDYEIIGNILLPIALAYITAEIQINRSRKKEKAIRERDWLEKTSSICHLILWEFEHVDGDVDVTDRIGGESLNEFGNINEISYLDDRFLELISHSSNAPSTISNDIIDDIKKVTFEYANPEPDEIPGTISIGNLQEDLQSDIENIQNRCNQKANKKSTNKIIR